MILLKSNPLKQERSSANSRYKVILDIHLLIIDRPPRMHLCNFMILSFKTILRFSLTLIIGALPVLAHQGGQYTLISTKAETKAAEGAATAKVSGQGDYKFRVLHGRDLLPTEALKVLKSAHGGFAIDRRQGKGEIYFALPRAGIIQISSDFSSAKMIDTAPEVKNTNMHNTTIWYGNDGTPYLTFPANGNAKIFTTGIDGKLLNTLAAPSKDFKFSDSKVDAHFARNGKFAPTDTDILNNRLYVTTGYSGLDYVLTADVKDGEGKDQAPVIKWNSLAFGGKGNAPGQFGTGHGVTIEPDGKHIVVADRPNSEIESFTSDGQYRSVLNLPKGSFPCDVDFEAGYTLVGCLHGPDRSKGATIYLLKGKELVSTIIPREELGLEKFTHIHNAVVRQLNGKLYIIAQAWNPGDFAILEQVK